MEQVRDDETVVVRGEGVRTYLVVDELESKDIGKEEESLLLVVLSSRERDV